MLARIPPTMSPPPAADRPSRAPWVLAVALPVFSVAARTVTDGWSHPWSHLWIPATVAVALEVRRLLHRAAPAADIGAEWHLYFLAAGTATTLLATGWELDGGAAGGFDRVGVAAVAFAAVAVARAEVAHLRSTAPRHG